jgi:tryptophan synthase beta subunit
MEQSEIIGHFGPYGGRFVPEALIAALEELEAAHNGIIRSNFPSRAFRVT